MKARYFIFFVLGFLYATAVLAGGTVELAEGTKAYFAVPERSEGRPRAGILVIHEWWGLADSVRALTDRFAEDGFAALAVDLYEGRVTRDVREAYAWMRGLREKEVMKKLSAGVDFLGKNSLIEKDRLGVAGWGMGGRWALVFASEDFRVRAVALYYGEVTTAPGELSKLRAPVLGIFGNRDRGMPPQKVEDFKFRLDQLEKRAEIDTFPGVGHGFASPGNPAYRQEAAEEAWARTRNFFISNLA